MLFLADKRDIDPKLLSCTEKVTPFTKMLFSYSPVNVELVKSLRQVLFATVIDGNDNDGLRW
jgi:hypothetical protein